jgi:serine/threonine protein kinase/tetratricopeptide (TPR) repeat protein
MSDDETRLGDAPPPLKDRATRLEAGDAFGPRYRILKELGAGGMGVVYQAWDQTLNVVVALKVIRREATSDPKALLDIERRFKRELLLARQVTHKNVVRIHDLGEVEGTKYITMSFVEGEDLSTILRKDGKLPVARVLAIARQVASGLEAAHEAGVVHRDLKPANIMIDADGSALIMDFGIALSSTHGPPSDRRPIPAPASAPIVAADDATIGATARPTAAETVMASTESTRTSSMSQGHVIGTLEYMSPEQSKGLAVDHRTDIYAFGLILTDLLVGVRVRKEGTTPWEALTSRIETPPTPIAARDPGVPEAFDAVITKCLQLDPADRYLTTRDLVAAIDRLDDDGNLIPEIKRWTPKTITAAAVLVTALVAGTWWFSRGSGVSAPSEPVSVLIADFTNKTNDPVFSGLIEGPLAVGVEGASFISAYPRKDALRLVTQLQPGAALNAGVAKLVAMREGLDVIVGGDIAPDGAGFTLHVTATRPETDEVVLDWSTNAADKSQVLDAVGRVAARVRETLGDTTTDSAARDGETFTAASLEAAKAYSEAQELQWAGKFEEAISAFHRSILADPSFGRAHSGLAALYANLGRPAEAETSYLSALSHLDRMTEREKYRTRGGYYLFKKNTDKAMEEFKALVAQYPADTSGLANVALVQFYRREMANSLETGKRASDIYPKNVIRRNNAALFAMYAGKFDEAITLAGEVLALQAGFVKAYVARALSHLALGRPDEALATWNKLDSIETAAAKSFAASGHIDLALFQGRDAEALKLIDAAIAADKKAGDAASVSRRLAIKSEVLLAQGNKAGALRAAREAATGAREEGVLYISGKTLIGAGDSAKALELASDLDNRLENEPRIYGALLRGEAALAAGRPRDALTSFEAGQKLADTWLGRLSLGRAYMALGAFPEAASEFDRCVARKGEATAVFLDDLPSYRLMKPVPALLDRARKGLAK